MGLFDFLKRRKEEKKTKTMGVKILKVSKWSHHHDILDAINKSPIVLTDKPTLKKLLKEENIFTYLIPNEELETLSRMANEDVKSLLLTNRIKTHLKERLGRDVLIEDIGIGLLLAMKRKPDEKPEMISKLLENAKIKDVIKVKMRDVLMNPIDEIKAKEIIARIPKKPKTVRVARKIMRVSENIVRESAIGKRKNVWFAHRVRGKPV